MGQRYYIGVDVGTGSVRAALVQNDGHIVSMAMQDIQIWNPEPNFYEQSTEDIWSAVVTTVRKVLSETRVEKALICGIGFDATCSLAILDENFQPVSVSKTGLSQCNVVMWMDHRAECQAERINSKGQQACQEVLKHVGGKMSLEMEPPKALWLKQNLKTSCWDKAAHFFDLPDYLTWRATESLSRSLCSLVCKWGYLADDQGHSGWSDSFLRQVGLEDLITNNYSKIGQDVKAPGAPCGSGLSAVAAAELGLEEGTPVGASIIDAHAGGIGSIGCRADIHPDQGFVLSTRLALISGTSTCHMTLSEKAIFVPGVWGPYNSAMIPGLWTNEAGQSATGKLVDHIVQTHHAYNKAQEMAKSRNITVSEFLNTTLTSLAERRGLDCVAMLTQDLHIWPDFHGNRAPLADPTLKGMISGLSLSCGVEDLSLLYLATIQAIAYGTRHILEELAKQDHGIKSIYVCGGSRKNSVYVSTHADVIGMPVVLPRESESVLLGSAILGACASGDYPSIKDAMEAMGGCGDVILPSEKVQSYHEKKYKVFRKMVLDQQSYRTIMTS